MEADILSATATHSVRAAALIAGLPPGVYADTPTIAAAIGAPPNYLGKLLGKLARAGLLEARKGAGGGFRLAKPASTISLRELLEPVDRVLGDEDCFLGSGDCGGEEPCPFHEPWSRIRGQWLDLLGSTYLGSLIGRLP